MTERQELPPDALQRMFLLQHAVQQAYETRLRVPTVPLHMTDEQRIIYVKDMGHAIIREFYEYLDELKWKPWSDRPSFFNRKAAFGEAVDMYHFVMNLLMAAAPDGADPTDVARMLFTEYRTKNAENQRRALEGYDAVSDKCPSCNRDLRDLVRHMEIPESGRIFCYCDEDVTEAVHRILAADKCPNCKRDIRDMLRHQEYDEAQATQIDEFYCYCGRNITAEVNRILAVDRG